MNDRKNLILTHHRLNFKVSSSTVKTMPTLSQALLLKLPPELAHTVALTALTVSHRLGLLPWLFPAPSEKPVSCLGLTFPNPIGLSAGLDKNADALDALGALGFGFVEIGTITPRPQVGNPRPRLFRLPESQALINRMGFNNKGIDYVVNRLKHTAYRGILGINIGKNKDTPPEAAIQDYLTGFHAFAPYASYITLNISSPNTRGLRDLQQQETLNQLLTALKSAQARQNRYVPLLVKIAPDLSQEAVRDIAEVIRHTRMDGVIATNTTVSREGIEDHPLSNEAGGLSGPPLLKKSTDILEWLAPQLDPHCVIVAAGGIHDEASLLAKQKAGAHLFQVYTGLVYEGPTLIKRLVEAIPPSRI